MAANRMPTLMNPNTDCVVTPARIANRYVLNRLNSAAASTR
jgi:hypothetical protein